MLIILAITYRLSDVKVLSRFKANEISFFGIFSLRMAWATNKCKPEVFVGTLPLLLDGDSLEIARIFELRGNIKFP